MKFCLNPTQLREKVRGKVAQLSQQRERARGCALVLFRLKEAGFTLIEVMISLTILAVLIGVVVGFLANSAQVKLTAEKAKYQEQARQVSDAIDKYYLDESAMPAVLGDLVPTYLKTVPKGPGDTEWTLVVDKDFPDTTVPAGEQSDTCIKSGTSVGDDLCDLIGDSNMYACDPTSTSGYIWYLNSADTGNTTGS